MKTLSKIMIAAAVTMLPVAALAADTTAASPETKAPAMSGMGMHGDGMMFKSRENYWKDMDTNGDGSIDLKEWQANSAKRFKEYDTNGDGKISKDEIEAHRKKMREHFEEMRDRHRQMMHDQMMNGGMMDDKGDSGK